MNGITDVAIVGAGPYGLSVAAHLRRSGQSVRQFGLPMHLWRASMPRGMFLKSQGFASNLSDPAARLTLAAFCRETGRPYADYGLPVPLDTFVAYGQWFQSAADLNVEEVLVTGVTPAGDGYELTLADGETLLARQVVVAVGVEHFAYLPEQLAALPAGVCTHSSAHTDLAAFAGQRVTVVGAGQSALESAALLHEHGAQVQIVMRAEHAGWNGAPLAPDRPLWQRLREPEAGLGSGWGTWFYSRKPAMFRHLPEASRVRRARTALGPAGASWLRGRVEGEFPVLGGLALDRAESGPEGAWLGLSARLRRPDRDGRGPCHRGHRLPARPEPADVPRRGAAVPAAHRGGHPRGGPRLPDQRPRAVRGGPGRGPDLRPGHAVRVRRGSRGPDRGRAAGCRGRPARERGRGGRPVSRVPDRRASPGRRPGRAVGAGFSGARERPASTVSLVRCGHANVLVRTGRVAAAVAMPLADLTALAAATAVAGLAGGLSGWLVAGYAAAVFLVLSAIGLHRLRICLRVGDQSGRIIVAAAVPALAVAPWITAGHAVALAVGTAGLLLAARVAACAVLRSAHRHGRLTERAVLVGAGPEGRQLATLLDEHPELGLRPVGFLDDPPAAAAPRRGAAAARGRPGE